MDSYCIYLRKSRADLEAEARGEGETLARHRATLMELANTRGLSVGCIYEEIVSGDTIAGRPEMQRLLRDLENRLWRGVICMDIDRLGRGDSSDQGRILKTLKYAGAIIITLYKTFNPAEEMDEEFFEYGQYMARSEYRRIKRRMWAGRCASAKEGKYQSPKPPFGYERIKLCGEKGWSLIPVPDQAEAVRLAFSLYAYGENGQRMGMPTIADRLNRMGFTTHTGKPFLPSSISSMLHNPVYLGKIRWCHRRSSPEMSNGQEIIRRPLSQDMQIYEGRHPAIIGDALWQAVQKRLDEHTPHIRHDIHLSNPFAGLLVCAQCGRSMVRTPVYHRNVPQGAVRCCTPHCPTSSIDIPVLEDAVLDIMRQWLTFGRSEASMPCLEDNTSGTSHALILHQLESQEHQQERLHMLLETGVYDAATFEQRQANLAAKRASLLQQLALCEASSVSDHPETALNELRSRILHVLDAYPLTDTGEQRNQLLRCVIHKIVYHKTRRRYRNETSADCLTLDIFPSC